MSDLVYVVTRGSRRVEPNNYLHKEDADNRARSLMDTIQKWDKPSNKENLVKVLRTTQPHRIK